MVCELLHRLSRDCAADGGRWIQPAKPAVSVLNSNTGKRFTKVLQASLLVTQKRLSRRLWSRLVPAKEQLHKLLVKGFVGPLEVQTLELTS